MTTNPPPIRTSLESSIERRLARLESALGLDSVISFPAPPPVASENAPSKGGGGGGGDRYTDQDMHSRIDRLLLLLSSSSSSYDDVARDLASLDGLLRDLEPGLLLTHQSAASASAPLLYRREEILASMDRLKSDFDQLGEVRDYLLMTRSSSSSLAGGVRAASASSGSASTGMTATALSSSSSSLSIFGGVKSKSGTSKSASATAMTMTMTTPKKSSSLAARAAAASGGGGTTGEKEGSDRLTSGGRGIGRVDDGHVRDVFVGSDLITSERYSYATDEEAMRRLNAVSRRVVDVRVRAMAASRRVDDLLLGYGRVMAAISEKLVMADEALVAAGM